MNIAKLVRTGMNAVPSALKARVTFTKVSQVENETTGAMTPVVTSVSGTASRGAGDPRLYTALSLVESEAPTLIFVADTVGDVPLLGSTCSWGGVTYTVRHVDPIAPGGSSVAAMVVIAR